MLGIGMRGLISRRPFLLPASWLLGGVLLALAPPLVQSLLAPAAGGTPVGGLGNPPWPMPVLFGLVAVTMAL
jgi:hypothetical protein